MNHLGKMAIQQNGVGIAYVLNSDLVKAVTYYEKALSQLERLIENLWK